MLVAFLIVFALQEEPEAISLLGEELFAPAASEEAFAKHADALVWAGRRAAYIGRYRDAVKVYTRGIELYPDDPRFWRHRGHRWITLRQFEKAVSDLARAAELVADRPDEPEPPGTPNARGVVIDTLKQNIFYHLGLAHYLLDDFEAALPAWRECRRFSENPDALCSSSYWLAMTLRRLGRDEEAAEALAPITPDLDVIEYDSYHRLALAWKGELDPGTLLEGLAPDGDTSIEYATVGYGVGNLHLVNGDVDRAREIFEEIVTVEMWAAFGRIASEAELLRWR